MTTVTISQFEVYRIDSDEAGGKNLIQWSGVTGFEPATPTSRTSDDPGDDNKLGGTTPRRPKIAVVGVRREWTADDRGHGE